MENFTEFENYVIDNNPEILNTGILDDFFSLNQSNNIVINELNEIPSLLKNLQDNISKWNEISFKNQLCQTWDENAIKIAELREEYIQRRKELAKSIKAFIDISSQLPTSNHDNEDYYIGLKHQCLDLIDKFKAEFDYVANNYKFNETCYLSTYRCVRDLPDPCAIIQEAITLCNSCYIIITDLKAEVENYRNNPQFNSNASNGHMYTDEDIEKLQLQADENLDNLRKEKDDEIMKLRELHHLELKTNEEHFKNYYDQEILKIQGKHEKVMVLKESEMNSLLSSLNEKNLYILETNEKEKRQFELVEKLKLNHKELMFCNEEKHVLNSQLLEYEQRYKALQDQMEMDKQIMQKSIDLITLQLSNQNEKVKSLEVDLSKKMSLNIEQITSKLGIILPEMNQENASKLVNVEDIIIEHVRKNNSYVVETRVAYEEILSKYNELQQDFVCIESNLQEKNCTIATLEKDLQIAHNTIMMSHSNSHDSSSYVNKSLNSSMKYQSTPTKHHYISSLSSAISNTPTSTFLNATKKSNSYLGIFGTADENISPPVQLFRKNNDLDELDELDDLEYTENANGANVNKKSSNISSLLAETPTTDARSSISDSRLAMSNSNQIPMNQHVIIEAIENQRDRYMKLSKEKETELTSLSNQYEKLQEEQAILKNENLELYRRIRFLRACSRQSYDANSNDIEYNYNSYNSDVDNSSNSRRRNVDSSNKRVDYDYDESHDVLDNKYFKIYEDQIIDPFEFEELERQSLLSNFSIIERSFAYFVRFFLQDNLSRKLLLIYLILVHLFAFGYVVQVLNPQLIEEVDYYTKMKYADQTLNIHMDMEHPDN